VSEGGGRPNPVVLCVLDGFGLSDDPMRNALLAARMPTWARLTAEWPTCQLDASGEAVGLPAGQMGNSEVGHLNLGAGFRVLQDLPRISEAIADGSFFENPVLIEAARHALDHGTRLHLLGLIGPGGVHAVDEHLLAMVELAAQVGLPADRVLLHAFTDGRDTAPRSAVEFLPALERRIAERATIATLSGRFYAMDRDGRWDRIASAWGAIVHGQGEPAPSASEAIERAYQRGESDEFMASACPRLPIASTRSDRMTDVTIASAVRARLNGCKTRMMFARYDIVDAADLRGRCRQSNDLAATFSGTIG